MRDDTGVSSRLVKITVSNLELGYVRVVKESEHTKFPSPFHVLRPHPSVVGLHNLLGKAVDQGHLAPFPDEFLIDLVVVLVVNGSDNLALLVPLLGAEDQEVILCPYGDFLVLAVQDGLEATFTPSRFHGPSRPLLVVGVCHLLPCHAQVCVAVDDEVGLLFGVLDVAVALSFLLLGLLPGCLCGCLRGCLLDPCCLGSAR